MTLCHCGGFQKCYSISSGAPYLPQQCARHARRLIACCTSTGSRTQPVTTQQASHAQQPHLPPTQQYEGSPSIFQPNTQDVVDADPPSRPHSLPPVCTQGPAKAAQAAKSHKHRGAAATHADKAAESGALVTEWKGLATWRAKGVDRGRGWGKKGPTADLPAAEAEEWEGVPLAPSLVECALQVLNTASPTGKAALTHRAWLAYNQGSIPLMPASSASSAAAQTTSSSSSAAAAAAVAAAAQTAVLPASSETATPAAELRPERGITSRSFRPQAAVPVPPDCPARPDKPTLVVPKLVPSFERGESPMTSNAAHMLHNLAHIELNAVDLAWDTVARFADGEMGAALPDLFFEDFARVADDESRHLGWCLQRLAELGHAYGDMPAHNLLWEGAQSSSQDLSARLAVVPMSQEARGLDAGQRLVAKLVGSQDKRSAAIVDRISQEERAHVAVGIAWFKRVCLAMGVEVPKIFRSQVGDLCPELLKGPFNHAARQEVGLARDMYDLTAWPEAAAKSVVPPAQAAYQRGKGRQVRQLAEQQELQAGGLLHQSGQQRQAQQRVHQEQQQQHLASQNASSHTAAQLLQQQQQQAQGVVQPQLHVAFGQQQDQELQQGSGFRGHEHGGPGSHQTQPESQAVASMARHTSCQGEPQPGCTSVLPLGQEHNAEHSTTTLDSHQHGVGVAAGDGDPGAVPNQTAKFGAGKAGVRRIGSTDHTQDASHMPDEMVSKPPVVCGLVPEGQGAEALLVLRARLADMLEIDGLLA